MKPFSDWYHHRHEYAKEWKKRTGGKVFGYFCTYVPEEILYAGNILPVRILGSHEPQDVTEPHIFSMFCPFCRDCLAQGLKGRYDYLDGIVIAQSCLHIRQAFTSWQLHIPIPFSYYIPFPVNVQSPKALPYLTQELRQFKLSVENWLGKPITDSDLDRGIEVMNTHRRLLMELYSTRKSENPPITGLDAMYAVVSSQIADKTEHNQALTEVLDNLRRSPSDGSHRGKVRLMILGSEDDDTEFVKMVESVGAIFVIDEHCTGTRYFWEEVKPDEDRLKAIAERYIRRPPCPSKDWPERRRIPHILSLAKEYQVQGVILIQQKFCDPHELDIPAIRQAFKEAGLPTLFLEFDVTVPYGQFRTRVEALLETIQEEELF